MLGALRKHGPLMPDRLAKLTDQSPNSGVFRAHRKALKDRGLIAYGRGEISLAAQELQPPAPDRKPAPEKSKADLRKVKQPDPRTAREVEGKWPQPNKSGAYSTRGAEKIEFVSAEGATRRVRIYCLRIGPSAWITSPDVECGRMRMFGPLTAEEPRARRTDALRERLTSIRKEFIDFAVSLSNPETDRRFARMALAWLDDNLKKLTP